MYYDKIIVGAGLYGLYAALYSAKQNQHVLVMENDSEAFKRATYINQARVHMGYHYPRSYSTAIKSAHYFNRFMDDYGFCVLTEFDQIYATSAKYSWTNAQQFQKFCAASNIRCDGIDPLRYFKKGLCDGAFFTTEYTYDAKILRDYFLSEIGKNSCIEIRYNSGVTGIERHNDNYLISSRDTTDESPFVLNATYASTNQLNAMLGFEPFRIKYELCEIILCEVEQKLKGVGLTVMDGPFFSIMPFGNTQYHSLTAVCFTPHMTSFDTCPQFKCQQSCATGYCSSKQLGNCNDCISKPTSAWPYMSGLAHKYIRDDLGFSFARSLYAMKPILKASEVDDSRPTVIRTFSEGPTFVSVLSGKINSVYDLEEVLDNEK